MWSRLVGDGTRRLGCAKGARLFSPTFATVQALTRSSSGSGANSFSSLERIGRDGFLHLRFARTGQGTVLCASRFTHPLRVQDIGPTLDGVAYAMLLNPAGGLVGGDRLSTTIVLEPGAHAC